MKRTYSTLILLLGIGLGGLLFAQQSIQPGQGDQGPYGQPPDKRNQVQKDVDESGNVAGSDSTWSWTWSWDGEMPGDLKDHFQELFNQFHNGFYFNFNDSTGRSQHFQEYFDENFTRKLDNLKQLQEPFNEDFFKNLNKKLEKLQEADIHFQWDQNLNRHLEDGIEQMIEKWQQFYQEHQGDIFQPRRKAL